MKNFLILSFVMMAFTLVTVTSVEAGAEGRVAGTVEDSEGNPLVGVQITVRAVDYDFETSRTTNKKGRFTLLVMDATKDYTIRLEMEGFVPIEEPFDPPLGDTLRRTWTMMPGAGGGGGAAAIDTGEVLGPSQTDARGAVGRKYQQGMDAFQVDDLEKARTSFEEVVELQPDLPEAHVALALVLVRLEVYDESLAEAERALELRPGDVAALKIKYESYKGLGNQEMVEVMLDELIVVSPDEDLARLVFNSAVSKIQSGDLAGGAARLEQVRDIAPNLMPVYSALSRVYFDLQRYEESAAMANEYLAKEPGSGDVLGVLYLAYDKMEMTAEAEETFEALKGADSHSVVRVMEEMGISNFNAGNMAQAKDLFERILAIEPDHGRAHYHLGLCYVSMGDSAKGKEMLTRFVELAPNDPDAAVAQEMIATL